MTLFRALGLMSGTSMDGVDVALIETDGGDDIVFGPKGAFPYSEADRLLLRRAIQDAVGATDRVARPGALAAAEALVTTRHAEAVETFLAAQGLARADIDVIGFHGQTVLHRPERGLTIQIGDGAALAARLGMPVVWDLRADDVAAGGQGAPLVPIYHKALVEQANLDRANLDRANREGPVVVVNIGGVANITFIAPGRDPIACDTGPGNALLDDLMLKRRGVPFDGNGAAAAAGHVDQAVLAALLAHPFFALPAPKSLDRNAFSLDPLEGLSTEDAAATLVAFTASSIAGAVAAMPGPPRLAVVCGGGAHNPSLMQALAAHLPCPLASADALGWSTDAMEAQAFAYLAVRCLENRPITFPGTTGISAPRSGGRISDPRSAIKARA